MRAPIPMIPLTTLERETAYRSVFLAAPNQVAEAIGRLAVEDAVSLPLIGPKTCQELCAAAGSLNFRPGKPVVGAGESAVKQDFRLTMDFPLDSPFRAIAASLNRLLWRTFQLPRTIPLQDLPGFHLNDLVLQNYPKGSLGITPHRDHISYRGLVSVIPLSGAGRFYVCSDRQGRNPREIPAPPGHLVLMRAPGFPCTRPRPFHYVSGITAERLSLGLRYHVERA